MRKISKEAVDHFMAGTYYKNSNTEVMGGALYLHGHEIARKDLKTGVIKITDAGWSTNTTKERLNAIPSVHIVQKAGIWYLNGKVWGGEWIIIK